MTEQYSHSPWAYLPTTIGEVHIKVVQRADEQIIGVRIVNVGRGEVRVETDVYVGEPQVLARACRTYKNRGEPGGWTVTDGIGKTVAAGLANRPVAMDVLYQVVREETSIVPPRVSEPKDTSRPGQRARIIEPKDQPDHETLAGLTEQQLAALPARFHTPEWMPAEVGAAFVCRVCHGEGWVTAWPCATARKHGAEVFEQ
jgi:hypothetical protein